MFWQFLLSKTTVELRKCGVAAAEGTMLRCHLQAEIVSSDAWLAKWFQIEGKKCIGNAGSRILWIVHARSCL